MIIFDSDRKRRIESIKYILLHSWVNFCIIIMIVIMSIVNDFSNPIFPLIFSAFFLILIIFNFISKKSRIVDQFAFDDENKTLVVTYTYLIKKYTMNVKYSELSFKFFKKANRRFYNPMTFELHINGKYLAEIRYDDSFGWSNNSINLIVEKVKSIIKQNSSGI